MRLTALFCSFLLMMFFGPFVKEAENLSTFDCVFVAFPEVKLLLVAGKW